MEDYRTVRGTATGEYEEKKSRFIAQLSFADSEEAAVAFLEQVRAANRTARHNVYAYRLRAGNRERYSDDGEPAKTAGTPALEVLQHSGLTDLIVVVTRYFGGVLLGTGGLVRAYTTATARALENAEVVTVRSVVELQVTVDYALYERASLLIDAAGAKQAPPEFTDRVTLRWQMPEHTEAPLLEQLRWKPNCRFGVSVYETKIPKDFGCRYSFHKSYSYQLCAIEYDGFFFGAASFTFCFSPLKCGSLSNTEKILKN